MKKKRNLHKTDWENLHQSGVQITEILGRFGIILAELKATQKFIEHRGTMVSRGIWGALNWAPL